MKGFFSKLKKNKKGYTLTELIVVVAILGILAAIATPMILNAVGDAKESGTAASISTIESAVQLCLADGSLLMSGDRVVAPTGKSIGDQVKLKLVGHQLPINSTTSDSLPDADRRVWHFNILTCKVFAEAFTGNDYSKLQ